MPVTTGRVLHMGSTRSWRRRTLAGRRGLLCAAAALTALAVPLTAGGVVPPRRDAGGAESPRSSPVPTQRDRVGPLFVSGLDGEHTCTASVVDSPAGDALVTAAHCLSDTGVGVVFAPGYAAGVAPFGTWVVTAAYVDPTWVSDQDTADDVAFLVVAPSVTNPTTASVQSVVGANTLGVAPAPGQTVTVTGYPAGTGGTPITCTTPVSYEVTSPAVDCDEFVGGTSGSPWVRSGDTAPWFGEITGVIGGPHQGGCSASVSYSAPFTAATAALFARAQRLDTPSVLPVAGPSGC